ncbi:O-methyltransferase [Pyrinomonas methylaliphatogenes]|jgi:predicted O-methyltransferase YrrM|uniref:Predicted O-methyltransferase n=1 Tax=Pyrinomonas methylaliphatogenes TaxID=454194 RepID=A0A0B6WVW1_9BACT|nr:O-methyltransferase [Pyrinomonas methylaliphatogenes]MBX5478637.1 O-methyltransferase [Pyrinomonas methylaliphatogenes]CDM64892.1 predicted O-methyltransferase [Pyrinomonas methylaliphatogenes]
MKAKIDSILQREQAEYLETLLPASEALLREMEEYAAVNRVPIADREVALFLDITARAIGARRALEIGMAIGYSTIFLARATGEGGTVITIETKDEMIARATDYLERAGVRDRVLIERGRALDVLPQLEAGSFDLVFIDAAKREYGDYLDQSLRLLRPGGVVIVDNLLWKGQVAKDFQDEETQALRDFNRRFVSDERLRAIVIPLGDGLGYGIKIA